MIRILYILTSPAGASQGFRTDSDISGNLAMRERTLQRWEPAESEVHMSIETSNSTAGWDQFEANERLFGTKTNYDENVYTTRLDRSTPTYTAELERASRIAAEIEGTASDNSHMREERGLVAPATGDQDEEDKYSGVRREDKAFPPLLSGQPNKYTPPGRRQAAPQPPTLPNAPPKQAAATTSAAPVMKEDASTDQQPEPTTLQPSAEIEGGSASAKALSPAPPAAKRPSADNATANVEAEVLDHFRQFANSEKLKMQERRRNQASYDRTVKLNELMKFSKSSSFPLLCQRTLYQFWLRTASSKRKSFNGPSKLSNRGLMTRVCLKSLLLPPNRSLLLVVLGLLVLSLLLLRLIARTTNALGRATLPPARLLDLTVASPSNLFNRGVQVLVCLVTV